MAQITVIGKYEPIIISAKVAETVKDKWLKDPKSQDIIDLGDAAIKVSQIKAVEGAEKFDSTKKEYDLHNPSDYKTIKDFEEEYLKEKARYRKTKKDTEPLFDNYFLKERGAIRLEKMRDVIIPANSLWNKSDKEKTYGTYKIVILDPVLMGELNAKIKAVHTLESKRDYVKQVNTADFMKGRKGIGERMSMDEWKDKNLDEEELRQFENIFEQ